MQHMSVHLTVKPVYYRHLGTNKNCLDYQGVLIFQVSLYDKASFGTITKCVDYASVLINWFHCILGYVVHRLVITIINNQLVIT